MSSNLKVNTILPSSGDTVSIAGIASITSSVSIASSCTATTFYGNLTGTIQTALQTNITRVGTLSQLSVSGTTNPLSLTHTGGDGLQITRGGKILGFNANFGGSNTHSAIGVLSGMSLRFQVAGNDKIAMDSSGRLLVGTGAIANPKSSGAGSIDLDNQAFSIIVGGNHPSGGRSDNNAKTFRMSMVHHTLAEEPINILQGYCDSSDNNLYIGGGTGSANSVTQVRIYTGANTTTTGGTERIRVNNAGAIGLSGANYGSSGQVLTSQGSGSAVAWSTVSGTTINNNADNRLISGSNTANTLNGETNWYISGSSLALGTTSPAANFHMRNSYVSMRIDSDGSNNDTKFYNVTGTGKNNYIYFGDAADDDVGQIVYDHNGDQLKFVVGASERMRLDADGLTFNGDTAAANSLNDYEEGTFNASYYWSGSDANADGKYTKIGNRVIISIFEFAGGGQGLNDKDITYISGLPFSAHTQPNSTGVIVRYSGGDHQTIGAGEFCYLAQGGTRIKFDDTFNSGNGNWTLSLVYETTA